MKTKKLISFILVIATLIGLFAFGAVKLITDIVANYSDNGS